MAVSKGMSNSKRKALAKWFPTIAEVANNARTAAQLETVEIMMDIEQVSDLFASFEDLRQGRVVSLKNAFGDL